MAKTTLEMFLKVTGVNKASNELGKVSKVTKDLDKNVKNTNKTNAKFASGMSSLGKLGIAGAAFFAGKALINFSKEALNAAVSAEEAASAFGTVFADSAERATHFLENFSNKAGLTVSEAQQLTAILGSVAQGIGFTADESADLAIEMTTLAADIASFMNVSQGAAPVLQSFQRALVGERESLATYGIKISELEVQTKALMMTGAKNVTQLTRQEKGYATIALITQKAGVMVGDLDRTLEGFANQSRMVGAEIRELKEDIGRQLIPAAEAMLPVFREFTQDVAPILIDMFGKLAEGITDFILATQRLADVDGSVMHLIKNFGLLADEQRAMIDIQDRSRVQEVLNNNELQKKSAALQKQRSLWTVILPQTRKYGKSLEKDVNPQLKKMSLLLGLVNKESDLIKELTEDRTDAQQDFNRVAEKEALVTAQEALRKKELKKEIEKLLFFQNKGVDVAEELAVKQEELKLVELDLIRESDDLIDATSRLAEANTALIEALDPTSKSLGDQLERVIELETALNGFEPGEFMSTVRLMADTLGLSFETVYDEISGGWLELMREFQNKPFDEIVLPDSDSGRIPHKGVVMPEGERYAQRGFIDGSGTQGGNDTKKVELDIVLRDEAMQEIVARVNRTIQFSGDSFVSDF